jgi:hypothetical protein
MDRGFAGYLTGVLLALSLAASASAVAQTGPASESMAWRFTILAQ